MKTVIIPRKNYRFITLTQSENIEGKPSCFPKNNSSAKLFLKRENTSPAKRDDSEDSEDDDESLIVKKQKFLRIVWQTSFR